MRAFSRLARVPSECARNALIVCHSSATPLPVVASVLTIGGRHSPFAEMLQREVRLDRRHHAIGAVAIALVDHEDVGDLHDAGLERLHVVAGARHQHDDRDVGGADDVDFVLADADGFDDHEALAGGVEHQRRIAGRAREAAHVAARRHAADEHLLVLRVRLHAQRDRRESRRR